MEGDEGICGREVEGREEFGRRNERGLGIIWKAGGSGGNNMGRGDGRGREGEIWEGDVDGDGGICGREVNGEAELWGGDENHDHDEWVPPRSGRLPRTPEMSTRSMRNGLHQEVAIYRELKRCQPRP